MGSLSACSDAILLNLWRHVLGDLHTHIALAQTCKRFRELYNRDDALWQAACFSAGFGRPLRRGRSLDAVSTVPRFSYRKLATLLVTHAAICEIRSCAKANACFAHHYSRWPFTRVRPLRRRHRLEFHPLYFYLHFSQTHSTSLSRQHPIHPHTPTPSPSPSPPPPSLPDSISILLSHLPTFQESRYAQYGPLCTHPNASCAFVTFPPVDKLEFENGEGEVFMVVENPEGCTVLDVNRALAELQVVPHSPFAVITHRIPFDDQHLEFALSHYQELAFTSGLSLAQFVEIVSQDKGFLDDHEYPFLQHIVAPL
ncbi:hypothetical protein BD414DRAFT_415396 [Trametes punicea]|nr:hypothetical protein BD414DRAFT_415396 [Trametes punicea]